MFANSNILKLVEVKNEVSEKDTISEEDFIDFIKENKISLYRLAVGILKNNHDAEDAINESILKCYENLSKLRKRENFKAWMMKILVNQCYTLMKKRNRIELQEDMAIYDVSYEENNNYELRGAIDKLSLELRTILILFYYEDLSLQDISSILMIPMGTVKSRLSRAKKKLKMILEET